MNTSTLAIENLKQISAKKNAVSKPSCMFYELLIIVCIGPA